MIDKTPLSSTYFLRHNDIEYIIKITNKRANKHTVIHCDGGMVVWEQIYPLGIKPVSERFPVCKADFTSKKQRGVVVIQGAPSLITGLDEGSFISSRGTPKSDEDVFVMSFNAFKTFLNGK